MKLHFTSRLAATSWQIGASQNTIHHNHIGDFRCNFSDNFAHEFMSPILMQGQQSASGVRKINFYTNIASAEAKNENHYQTTENRGGNPQLFIQVN